MAHSASSRPAARPALPGLGAPASPGAGKGISIPRSCPQGRSFRTNSPGSPSPRAFQLRALTRERGAHGGRRRPCGPPADPSTLRVGAPTARPPRQLPEGDTERGCGRGDPGGPRPRGERAAAAMETRTRRGPGGCRAAPGLPPPTPAPASPTHPEPDAEPRPRRPPAAGAGVGPAGAALTPGGEQQRGQGQRPRAGPHRLRRGAGPGEAAPRRSFQKASGKPSGRDRLSTAASGLPAHPGSAPRPRRGGAQAAGPSRGAAAPALAPPPRSPARRGPPPPGARARRPPAGRVPHPGHPCGPRNPPRGSRTRGQRDWEGGGSAPRDRAPSRRQPRRAGERRRSGHAQAASAPRPARPSPGPASPPPGRRAPPRPTRRPGRGGARRAALASRPPGTLGAPRALHVPVPAPAPPSGRPPRPRHAAPARLREGEAPRLPSADVIGSVHSPAPASPAPPAPSSRPALAQPQGNRFPAPRAWPPAHGLVEGEAHLSPSPGAIRERRRPGRPGTARLFSGPAPAPPCAPLPQPCAPLSGLHPLPALRPPPRCSNKADFTAEMAPGSWQWPQHWVTSSG
ncbi:basic proline-rich protein-like [Perognathus longimembris pacificus]|uniref:basic proline-rich protein-like n=1 Tax=Perognathus longimembris pacificus TaxID=214514 RepID=UPI0020188102|nr:basic proline-rich protein-like [Perognathus longimembris pacificus]